MHCTIHSTTSSSRHFDVYGLAVLIQPRNKFTLPTGIYVRRKVRIRTILGFSCANLGSYIALLRKPSDRAEYFAQTSPTCSGFSTLVLPLPASGRSACDGSCVSFLVCFCARYTVGYTVWHLGTEEPRLLGHGTRVRILATRSDTRLP